MRSGNHRPGGRTAVTARRVHAAVRELLQESAGAPLQMAQIAARSGVNVATLYRRWGSSDAVVLDVVVEDLSSGSPVTATGDLRTDLLEYARQVQQGVTQPSGLHFLRAIAAVTATADGEALARRIAQRRLDELSALLEGTDSLDAVDIVNGVIAPITYRRLLAPQLPLADDEIERLVDILIDGAAARTRRPSTTAETTSAP